MKNRHLLIILAALILGGIMPQDVSAQRISITPFAGYMFGGKMRLYEGEVKIENGLNYGAMLDVEVAYATHVQVSYTRMVSDGSFVNYKDGEREIFQDVSTNYIHIGTIRDVEVDGPVTPYGHLGIGATLFKHEDYSAS